MSEARIKIDGKEYEVPTLTLGEQRAVKRVSGMVWSDLLPALESGDPDAVVGFLFAVLKRAHPERSEASLVEQIERLTGDDFEDVEAEEDDAGPPAVGGTGFPSLVTTPAPSGIPPSGSFATSARAT